MIERLLQLAEERGSTIHNLSDTDEKEYQTCVAEAMHYEELIKRFRDWKIIIDKSDNDDFAPWYIKDKLNEIETGIEN